MRRSAAIIILCFAATYALALTSPFSGMQPPAGCGVPCGPGSGNQYFVDSVNGNDLFNGLSPSAPWKTIAKANANVFPAGGFGLYFKGGQSFTGCLLLSYATNVPVNSGPILVNSYGVGTPNIVSNCPGVPSGGTGPRTSVVHINGLSNVTVQNLQITCGGTQYGILLQDYNNSVMQNITLQQNNISGCFTEATADAGAGIEYQGDPGATPCAFNNLSVLNNTIHGTSTSSPDDNGFTGFALGNNVCNVLFQGNLIYNEGAKANYGNNGHGAFLVGMQTATAQFNIAHDLGGNMNTCGGDIGFGTFAASDSVIIQYNEAYNIQPLNFTMGCDWDGFDIDGESTNVTVQYNYSHNNWGPGFITYALGVWGPNTIRFNISENDAAGGSPALQEGAIDLGGSGTTAALEYIYNNTVWEHVPGATVNSCPFGFVIETRVPTGGLFANNILDMTSTGAGSNCNQGSGVASFIWGNNQNPSAIPFENNDYHASSGSFQVFQWNNANYASLAAWQAVAPNGDANSLSVDPAFTDGGIGHTCGFTGTYPAGPQAVSNCPAGYILNPSTSTLIGAGANLAANNPGISDYYGNIVPNNEASGFNIGADNTAPSASQPSWVMPGASLACNFTVSQCWNGSAIVPASQILQSNRFGQEACQTATTITYAGISQPCVTSLGLAMWGNQTNYLLYSYDLSAQTGSQAWESYTGGSGATVSITGNNTVAPDGSNTASTITVSRTTGAFGQTGVQLQDFPAPGGTYTYSMWIKGAPGSIGNTITVFANANSHVNVKDVKLTAAWQNVVITQTGVGACVLYNCAIGAGYYSASGNTQSGSTTFYAWGGQVQTGTVATPVIRTNSVPVTQIVDNNTSAGLLTTLLNGSAGTVYMTTTGGAASTASTLLDANGTTWLGETSTNNLTMGFNPPLTTTNVATWTGPVTSAVAWNTSGRTIALSGAVGPTDSHGITKNGPYHLGSLGGTTVACNCYLQTINVFNTAKNINNPGTGVNYYVAAAGNDADTGLTGHPWATPARAMQQTYYGGDVLSFNGGDSFTGCMAFQAGQNVFNSAAGNVFTIGQYGTGKFTITSNCLDVGTFQLNGVSGMTIQDAIIRAGATSARAGVELQNLNTGVAMDTIIVQRCDIGGFDYFTVKNGTATGAEILIVGWLGPTTNVYLLNNTLHGLSGATSPDDNGLYMFPNVPLMQNIFVQGNYVYNIGGANIGSEPTVGNGLLLGGVGKTGSLFPGDGGTVQFNLVTNTGANSGPSSGPVGIETFVAVGVTINNNEVTAIQPVPHTFPPPSHAGSDYDGIDLDGGSSRSIVEYNYVHNNWGAGALGYIASEAGGSGPNYPWGSNHYRFNIFENNDNKGDPEYGEILLSNFGGASNSPFYVYNNTTYSNQTFTFAFGSYNNIDTGLSIPGHATLTGVVANNIFNVSKNAFGQFTGISNPDSAFNSPSLLLVNNDIHSTNGGTYAILWRNTTYASIAAWQAAATNATGNLNVVPTFNGTVPYGSNCMSAAAGSTTGPQNGASCPNVYLLGGASALLGAGAALGGTPYFIATGNLDYYAGPVPNTSTSGFNVGADNTYSPTPTCADSLVFSATCNSQYLGKGFGPF